MKRQVWHITASLRITDEDTDDEKIMMRDVFLSFQARRHAMWPMLSDVIVKAQEDLLAFTGKRLGIDPEPLAPYIKWKVSAA